MRLAEELRKLQVECLKNPDEFIPETDVAFLEDVAKRLEPIIALAEAQENQHSADLREVAEMAIDMASTHCINDREIERICCDSPDSILSAWRARKAASEQQKSKGGDAREPSKSSQSDQR